ncbi:MAG: lytic transglycosylase domain-containing protein [Planctomycetes bacterium]|nr:lytic transglycosylase domain-containing protein [Planctomycetota bacterium]
MLELLLAAMIQVESGGNCYAVGKAGEQGPLQIMRPYWQDACEQLEAEGGHGLKYDDHVHNELMSRVIAKAYFRRYESEHYPPKTMAGCRVLASAHRKGWNWRAKKNAKAVRIYWAKVKLELEKK